MRCIVLASGSRGNCTVIEGSAGTLLVDAGLSAKELLGRMGSAGVDPDKIDAVLVTHEHGDHIRGLDVLARKLDIPVYATEGTLRTSFSIAGYPKNRSATIPAGISSGFLLGISI